MRQPWITIVLLVLSLTACTPLAINPHCGAADKAVNLVGCKSPHHQLSGIGWLAYPMHAVETKHVLLGRKKASAAWWR
jgi:hypothetical protein